QFVVVVRITSFGFAETKSSEHFLLRACIQRCALCVSRDEDFTSPLNWEKTHAFHSLSLGRARGRRAAARSNRLEPSRGAIHHGAPEGRWHGLLHVPQL